MGLIFILVTQLINHTTSTLSFEADDHGRRPLPELPRGKTRLAKQSRILRRLRGGSDPESWRIRILLDGEFTGIQIHPKIILTHVRLLFRLDGGGVLHVDGVPEIRGGADVLFRHRYFGWMRDFYWDSRPLVPIARSDTKLATKLRNAEGHCQHLAPFVDLQKRYASPPTKYRIEGSPAQQSRPRYAPRPLDLLGRPSGEQTRIDGDGDGISRPQPNARATHQQARPRDIPGPQPQGRYGNDDYANSTNGRATHQQVRPRDVPGPQGTFKWQTSTDDDADDITSPQPNARAATHHQQEEPRDIPGLRAQPQERSKWQTSTDDDGDARATHHQQVRPRDVSGGSRWQTSTDDDEDDIDIPRSNPRATHHQHERPRDIIHGPTAQPQGRSTWQTSTGDDKDARATHHQQVRPRDIPRWLTSNDNNEDDTDIPQSNPRATHQQLRPRDIPRPQASTNANENKISGSNSNAGATRQQVGPRDAPRPPPNVAATPQQLRRRDAAEKHSCIHGIALMISLMILVLLKFLF